jgi:hypothetical protein
VADLLFQIKDLRYLARGPRAYARRRTPAVRRVLGRALRMTRPVALVRRRAALRAMPPSPFRIPERVGIARIPEFGDGLIAAAVDEAKRLAVAVDLDGLHATSPDRHLVTASVAGRLEPGSAILRLALALDLVRAIGDYIGTVPVLEDVMLWYSPNEKMLAGSSQYYHLDGQDTRTLQLFVHLDDVTDENGPLTAISAAVSENIARRIRYRKNEVDKRVGDDIVDRALTSRDDRVVITGPTGTAHLVDTDRCFHFGSRAGTKPRLMLVIQYYSPFAFVLPGAWSSALPFSRYAHAGFTDLERLVLGAAR